MIIPRLDHREAVSETAQNYVQALHTLGFEGDIHCDDATRAVLATDNSIYQIYPQAVVFPNHDDPIRVMRHLTITMSHYILEKIGTNAQSLGAGSC